MKLLIQGAASQDDLPGFKPDDRRLDVVFAPDRSAFERELPGTEILLGWNFKGRDLSDCWHLATDLNWIHWCGAGVDALLFDDLRANDVVLTNARGVFDRAMAETVLGYMLYTVKNFARTVTDQSDGIWNHRMNHRLQGGRVLIFGVGSIGREVARVLRAMGLSVSGVGRTERKTDPDFDHVYAPLDIDEQIFAADWVVSILPATPSTNDYFDHSFFARMNPGARFINLGRGQAVIEKDLANALAQSVIAGAMLDVFRVEPLEGDSDLWNVPNLFISPHNSGDYFGFEEELVHQFNDNLERFLSGQELVNVVDKKLGFVASEN